MLYKPSFEPVPYFILYDYFFIRMHRYLRSFILGAKYHILCLLPFTTFQVKRLRFVVRGVAFIDRVFVRFILKLSIFCHGHGKLIITSFYFLFSEVLVAYNINFLCFARAKKDRVTTSCSTWKKHVAVNKIQILMEVTWGNVIFLYLLSYSSS